MCCFSNIIFLLSFLKSIINLFKLCIAAFLIKNSFIKFSLYSIFLKSSGFNWHVFSLKVYFNKKNKVLYSLSINFLSIEHIP